jgi:putative membrane protein
VEKAADRWETKIMMYGDDRGWGWMMVVMPLLWIGVTALIVWAVVRVAARPSAQPAGETPQEILDRRLARGEIDLDAYSAAKSVLAGDGPRSR